MQKISVGSSKKVLTYDLSVPCGGATNAKIHINAGDGNLTIDRLTGGEQVLASGVLEYMENQGLPNQTLVSSNGLVTITLRGGRAGRPWFRFPWSACNGATEWQIHLNSKVQSDITAHSDGGNVKLDLAGMDVTRVAADTGGGNVSVVLPDNAADLSVTAKTGAGNVTVEFGQSLAGRNTVSAESGAGDVTVHLPSDIAAKIHAKSGLGKVIMDARFSKLDVNTYQSPDYDAAPDKVEITVKSGAGNVSVNGK